MLKLNCNGCDGIYNSIDIHFTKVCDNDCAHCIDHQYNSLGLNRPDVDKIVASVIEQSKGIDDVLFLGGEPCLYLEELVDCVEKIKQSTNLKVFVTTAVPKVCFTKRRLFIYLINLLDGINLSTQHYKEDVADQIRQTKSKYDRQEFYKSLPYKEKIRINLNIVKPYLYTKEDITNCLLHYDRLGFNSIKLSEIQHGKKHYVSFADTFGIKMPSAYANGCQTYLDTSSIIPELKTPLLLKRSCFICEETSDASIADGLKILARVFVPKKDNYGVIYSDGTIRERWV